MVDRINAEDESRRSVAKADVLLPYTPAHLKWIPD